MSDENIDWIKEDNRSRLAIEAEKTKRELAISDNRKEMVASIALALVVIVAAASIVWLIWVLVSNNADRNQEKTLECLRLGGTIMSVQPGGDICMKISPVDGAEVAQ